MVLSHLQGKINYKNIKRSLGLGEIPSERQLECFLIYTSWDLISNTNTDCPRVLSDDKDQQKTWSPRVLSPTNRMK